MRKIMVAVLACLFLTGCGRRELEDRRFPTVLVAETGNIRRQEEEKQAQSSKYIDYGHVKAVILAEDAAEDGDALKEILSYLENDPVFARNMLMFVGDEEVCALAAEDEEKMGMYLENLAKNQPGGGKEELALKDFLNYLHNTEPSIQVPRLPGRGWGDPAGGQRGARAGCSSGSACAGAAGRVSQVKESHCRRRVPSAAMAFGFGRLSFLFFTQKREETEYLSSFPARL